MTNTSYIADLHIHSLYSRATSKASNLYGLACWAAIKGIQVVGTGDFTHPLWFAYLTTHLEPAEPGFYKLKGLPDFSELAAVLPPGVQPDVSAIRFVLSAEISSIYKRGGKVRKIHNILYAPDFSSVRRINSKLAAIGNLESDGRPILGLDSEILLEILLENAQDGFLVPAHIWTPWFSLFGSKSGFDDIEECFGELSSEIFALETGLSSDPEMNRCISALDRFTLISNSDCHSPSKLGREANVFQAEFNYFSMRDAIRYPLDKEGRQQFQATIEFYPEEGKYHCDGHRKCGVCLKPYQTVQQKGVCPECGKPLTIGVLYRVMELADRKEPEYPDNSPAVHSLIPLPEVLGELFNVGAASKKVAGVYGRLINTFGSEFTILMDTSVTDLAAASPMLAEAVTRIREKRVIRQAGFDGEFGVIKVFAEKERESLCGQLNLFGITPAKSRKKRTAIRPVFPKKSKAPVKKKHKILNAEQKAAVRSNAPHIIVKAGPGTGKTHTLVQRAVRLATTHDQGAITVITFTNKAADEIRQRLAEEHSLKQEIQVATFHSFCLHWLRIHNPEIQAVGQQMRETLLKRIFADYSGTERKALQREMSLFLAAQPKLPDHFPETIQLYFEVLTEENLVDLDAVIPLCTAQMHADSSFSSMIQEAAGHLLVDEFQDLNASQFELVCLLAQKGNIFAIGDPNQAIYGFRGSTPHWFDAFIKHIRPELHTLTANYRSGSVILEAANAVMGADKNSSTGTTKAASGQRGVMYRYQAATPAAEAAFIADQIQILVGGTSHREIESMEAEDTGNLSLTDIAILYRTGKQAVAVEEALAQRSIPCQVVDLVPFFCKGVLRNVYYHLLLASDRLDKAELLFIFSNEKGIGSSSLKTIEQHVADNLHAPFSDLLEKRLFFSDRIQKTISLLQKRAVQCQKIAENKTVCDCVDFLLKQLGVSPDDPESLRLKAMAGSAVSLPEFVEHLHRLQDSVIYDERAEAVLLATLHASKGLEFRAVFVAGCEEGMLPLSSREILSPEQTREHFQEERRLFFVGITRAERVLYCTGASERQSFVGRKKQLPSRFLADIPDELFSPVPERTEKMKKKRSFRQLRLF